MDQNDFHCDISFLPERVGISIYINLRTLATKPSDSNAELRASFSSIGLPEVIKHEMGVTADEISITGTIFTCLAKALALINNKLSKSHFQLYLCLY